jgi:hypothetical protein
MSYATVQDVLFALALDLDRCRVAESAEPTPRRPGGRTRISGSRAQSSGQAKAVEQMSRAAQPRPSGSGKSDRAAGSEKSKAELYEEAKEKDIPGRSKMSKDQLARALHKKDS